MKKIYFIYTLILALVVASCSPIEQRVDYKNSFNPDDIQLEVVQSANGTGNGLSLRMTTPGVTGYWDYILDKKHTDRVDVNFPLPGKQVFTFHVTTPYVDGGETVFGISKSIEVDIQVLDQPLPDAFNKLVGTDHKNGKTWVYDFDYSPGWWYMTDASWDQFWWQPGKGDAPDADGNIVFDLNGGANMTTNKLPAGEVIKGGWAFNGDYTKLILSGGAQMLSVTGGGVKAPGFEAEANTFDVIELTDDRLILFQNNMAWSPGWVWVFKAK